MSECIQLHATLNNNIYGEIMRACRKAIIIITIRR